jgi:hypothetical protein
LSSNFQDLTLANLDGEEAFFKDVRKFIEKNLFEVKPYNSAQVAKLYKQLQKEHSENMLSQNYMTDKTNNSEIIHWLKYQNMCYLDRDIDWILKEHEKVVVNLPPPRVIVSQEDIVNIVNESAAEFEMPYAAIKNLKNARYRNSTNRKSKDTQASNST